MLDSLPLHYNYVRDLETGPSDVVGKGIVIATRLILVSFDPSRHPALGIVFENTLRSERAANVLVVCNPMSNDLDLLLQTVGSSRAIPIASWHTTRNEMLIHRAGNTDTILKTFELSFKAFSQVTEADKSKFFDYPLDVWERICGKGS